MRRAMKELWNAVYGKEWKWLCSQPLLAKLAIVWFVVSLLLVCSIDDESSLCQILVLVLNFCASALGLAMSPVDGEGLDE
jgi:uncharacterized membrane protein